MRLEDTYNEHKKINCTFPWFKSKRLCEKGIHNYRINPQYEIKAEVEEIYSWKSKYVTQRIVNNSYRDLTNLKCFCCGKEEILEE